MRFDWKNLLAWLLILTAFLIIWFLPMKLPYSLVSVGRILPSKEWRLTTDASGTLTAQYLDHRYGLTKDLSTWQFNRGDLSGMHVWIDPKAYTTVNLGDTILSLNSISIQESLVEFQTNLAIRKAEIQELLTGEKAEILNEAAAKVEEAKSALEIAQQQYDIQSPLFKDGVIALTQFQQIEFNLKLAKNQLATAEKGLTIVNTGTKNETVETKRRQISQLEQQIKVLRLKNSSLIVRSPIKGYIVPSRLPEELFSIYSSEHHLIQIPVRSEEMPFVGPNVLIYVIEQSTNKHLKAHFLEKLNRIEVLDGKNVGFVLAEINQEDQTNIPVGLTASCNITCEHLNLRQYLLRILHFKVTN